MASADRAWLVIGVGVVGWDVLGDETLSAAFARGHDRWPWLVRGGVALLVAHLFEVLPLDPFDGVFRLVRKVWP